MVVVPLVVAPTLVVVDAPARLTVVATAFNKLAVVAVVLTVPPLTERLPVVVMSVPSFLSAADSAHAAPVQRTVFPETVPLEIAVGVAQLKLVPSVDNTCPVVPAVA